MANLLHILAAPRGRDVSRTLKVTEAFLEAYRDSHPDAKIESVNLFTGSLPRFDIELLSAKYKDWQGGEKTAAEGAKWAKVEALIDQFLSADGYLVSAPMWNFNIPYELKHYIDCIVHAGKTFDMSRKPPGLVEGRKMVVCTARGGFYGEGSPFAPFNYQENYLRCIFGFIGITDITFCVAEPTDHGSPEQQREGMKAAIAAAGEAARRF
ncbi:MAG: NAD(P)H-dependent oxidoreductase [Planctomycetota bacterium]